MPADSGPFWAALRERVPVFEFMWEPGASGDEVKAAELRLGVKFSQAAKDVARASGGAGFPSPMNASSVAAEVCLAPIRAWGKVPQEVLDLEVLGDLQHHHGEIVMIGDNPWGADYTVCVFLDTTNDHIHSMVLNTGECRDRGEIHQWLANDRFDAGQFREYSEDPLEIAAQHRFYLGIDGYLGHRSERLERWTALEARFLEAVRALRGSH